MEGSKIINIFSDNYQKNFVSHDVHLFMNVDEVNNNQLVLKTLKIIKLDNKTERPKRGQLKKQTNTGSPSRRPHIAIDSIKEMNHFYETNFHLDKPKVEDKEMKMFKNDLNKSKKNLLKIKYPKQVKFFLISISLFLVIVLITAFLEMYFKLVQVKK
jgi:hypothetical protein